MPRLHRRWPSTCRALVVAAGLVMVAVVAVVAVVVLNLR